MTFHADSLTNSNSETSHTLYTQLLWVEEKVEMENK